MDAALVKVNDNTIQITKTAPAPDPIVVSYDYDFLLSQRASIIKQANDFLAARQAELDEVNDLIAQADSLGVTSRVMPQPLIDPKKQMTQVKDAEAKIQE